MIKQLTAILVCLMATVTVGQKAPADLVAGIQKEFQVRMKYIFKEGTESDFSFSSTDKIEDITLSDFFKIYPLYFDSLKTFKQGCDVKTLATENPKYIEWHAFFQYKNELHGLITIANMKGQWKIVEMYNGINATALFILFKKYPMDKVFVFKDPSTSDLFFHNPVINKSNLSILNTTKVEGWNKNIYSSQLADSLVNITDAASTIVNIINKNETIKKKWHVEGDGK